MPELSGFIAIACAAMAAGFVNAIAGGGTLITYPVLIAAGIPAVAANMTNTIALLPGYLGGTLAQWADIKGQRKRLFVILPVALAGGLAGGMLLLFSGERFFRSIVPYLILLASGLLALQGTLRSLLQRRAAKGQAGDRGGSFDWSLLPLGLAAVYGGYFGAGLSVIVLAVLGLSSDEPLTRLNALKQAVAFGVNIAAAIWFAFSGRAVWPAVLVMAVAALAGGWLGGRLAGKVPPAVLRWSVVAIGTIVGVVYLVRG